MKGKSTMLSMCFKHALPNTSHGVFQVVHAIHVVRKPNMETCQMNSVAWMFTNKQKMRESLNYIYTVCITNMKPKRQQVDFNHPEDLRVSPSLEIHGAQFLTLRTGQARTRGEMPGTPRALPRKQDASRAFPFVSVT